MAKLLFTGISQSACWHPVLRCRMISVYLNLKSLISSITFDSWLFVSLEYGLYIPSSLIQDLFYFTVTIYIQGYNIVTKLMRTLISLFFVFTKQII